VIVFTGATTSSRVRSSVLLGTRTCACFDRGENCEGSALETSLSYSKVGLHHLIISGVACPKSDVRVCWPGASARA